jgi:cyclic pyranopterin phosphate synthase
VEDWRMKLSHLNEEGRPRMVDVSVKEPVLRTARARGTIVLPDNVTEYLEEKGSPKGNILNTATVAGIQAVKKTPSLIPLCHPLAVQSADVEFSLEGNELVCRCSVSAFARTGFEMEALTGVAVALLTVYDMLKAAGRNMVIKDVFLEEKTKTPSGAAAGEGL